MKIHCLTFDQFMKAVAALAEYGIGFNADADNLIINLTGAH